MANQIGPCGETAAQIAVGGETSHGRAVVVQAVNAPVETTEEQFHIPIPIYIAQSGGGVNAGGAIAGRQVGIVLCYQRPVATLLLAKVVQHNDSPNVAHVGSDPASGGYDFHLAVVVNIGYGRGGRNAQAVGSLSKKRP